MVALLILDVSNSIDLIKSNQVGQRNVEGRSYFFEFCEGCLFNGLRDLYRKYSKCRTNPLVCFFVNLVCAGFCGTQLKIPMCSNAK